MQHQVERFRARSRWLHWAIVLSAFALFVTGIFLYVPEWGVVAQDGWTRLFHRIAAIVFVAAPVLYFLTAPGRALSFIKTIFSWGKSDLKWAKAAPGYYFGGDESKMPPQPEMNTGQKLWSLVALVSAVGFVITGFIMWFFKGDVSPGVFQAAIVIHDVCLIVGGSMTLVHLYLGSIHPRMTESLQSMFSGKVSVEYAKSHYGKWYAEITGEEEAVEETPSSEGEE